jgi:ubiquinone/menaquinone biosynthesis C-methylase UbiE
MDSLQKLSAVYNERDKNINLGFKSNLDLIDSFYHERAVFSALKKSNFLPLGNKKIVDMGSGTGARLRNFLRLGASPKNLYGIDLSDTRTEIAKDLSPNFNLSCGDASDTGYEDNFFDIVINSTMMSSICHDSLAKSIADEMNRILKPGGIVLWYDMRYNNPYNMNVRGYTLAMIKDLFPNTDITQQSITLVPNITRKINIPFWLYQLIYIAPWLRTHYLCTIKKRT